MCKNKQDELQRAYLWCVLRFILLLPVMQKTPLPSPRTLARRCCRLPCAALFATLLHKQKVLSCMKLSEHLFFFFFWLFFSFVGVGRGAQATQSLRMSSLNPLTNTVLLLVCCFWASNISCGISWKLFLQTPPPPEFADWTAGSFINPSRLMRSAGQRNPGGLWPLTPVNPAPT